LEKNTFNGEQKLSQFTYLNPQTLVEKHPAGGVTFLSRHADRYPFEQPEDVFLAGLTTSGILAARTFGTILAKHGLQGRLFSSPIARCIDTARLIGESAGWVSPVQPHWWLFSPYLRSTNGNAAGIRFWAGDPQQAPQLYPDAIYARDRLEILLRRLQTPRSQGEIYLYIAHDTTVLPLLALLLGVEMVTADDMPGYLEGIALVRQDGRLILDNPDFYRLT
jgi:phosphohistidine phosphatase SixA